jgi:hypothetical protein
MLAHDMTEVVRATRMLYCVAPAHEARDDLLQLLPAPLRDLLVKPAAPAAAAATTAAAATAAAVAVSTICRS